jgi:glycyl-tRNA synthetase beta chain
MPDPHDAANQKYFPLFDAEGKLLNRFLIVSNMELADPHNIVTGNQRVVRPRLSDARFFFEQDKKTGLWPRMVKLESVVYHNKLGSQFDRVSACPAWPARWPACSMPTCCRPTAPRLLAKADLLTDMVGEFPELQGVMGRYYAQPTASSVVAAAIEQHYRPRFAGDALPEAVAVRRGAGRQARRAGGFFGIGQIPTGDKDPFGCAAPRWACCAS